MWIHSDSNGEMKSILNDSLIVTKYCCKNRVKIIF